MRSQTSGIRCVCDRGFVTKYGARRRLDRPFDLRRRQVADPFRHCMHVGCRSQSICTHDLCESKG